MTHYRGLIHKYRSYLPIQNDAHVITLYEGNTPLIDTPKLAKTLGLPVSLYFKYEGLNPTASFKDRGMTYAISKAVEAGAEAVICASTGNTSASAAAYAGRAGIKAIVLIPDGKIAYGKLSQAMIYGAEVLQIRGNFDQALKLVCEISEKYPITLVNSVNPHRLEGQKTAAFEIVEALGRAPDYHFLPVGNAGNITSYWMGYQVAQKEGWTETLPKMIGNQAIGADPIVQGKKIDEPETIATAIRIGNPASWQGALRARDESSGLIHSVSDLQILDAYAALAREGIFCEPASAASLAGLIQFHQTHGLTPNTSVVCTLTGHGLKDPDIAIAQAPKPAVVDADFDAIVKAIRV